MFYENPGNTQILLCNFTWAKFRSFYKKQRKLTKSSSAAGHTIRRLVLPSRRLLPPAAERINPRGTFSNAITFLFLLPLSHFIILRKFYNIITSKYILMFFHFDILRARCHFAFCLKMFPFRNSERANFPSAKITLKSPLPLVQCKLS